MKIFCITTQNSRKGVKKKEFKSVYLLIHSVDILVDVGASATIKLIASDKTLSKRPPGGDVGVVNLGQSAVISARLARLLHQLPPHRRARQRIPPLPLHKNIFKLLSYRIFFSTKSWLITTLTQLHYMNPVKLL